MHVAIIIDDGCGLTAAEVMLAAVRLVAYLARTVSVSFCINKKVVVVSSRYKSDRGTDAMITLKMCTFLPTHLGPRSGFWMEVLQLAQRVRILRRKKAEES